MQINKKEINNLYKKYLKNSNNKLIESAVTKNGIFNASYNNDMQTKHNFEFNTEVAKAGMTNQKSSGRCWIFAGLNMLKLKATKSLNVENFEFSQNYFLFWDKLEKSNTFLQLMIDNPKLKYEDRLFAFLMEGSVSDGGYWEWVSSLIKKYGAVPKSVMPETFNSSNTHGLNTALNCQLISATKEIREAIKNKASQETLMKIKHEALERIFEINAKALGLPPQKFSFEYRDKDKKFVRIENVTPLEFLEKHVGTDFLNKVNLLDDPRKENPKNRLLVAKYYKSVIEEKGLESLNVTMDVIKKAVIASLKDNEPVWFDCDVDAYSDRKGGIFDIDLYKYEEMLNIKNNLTKEDRVNYRLSAPTHAMTIVGVNLDKDNNPINWEIENSWGEDVGKKGYFSMSDRWFDEYVFGVIVDSKYVDKVALKGLEKPAIELEPWDPLS